MVLVVGESALTIGVLGDHVRAQPVALQDQATVLRERSVDDRLQCVRCSSY